MKNIPTLSASILAADITKLSEEVNAAVEAGVFNFHIDIMDGHFVPNISFGSDIVKALKRCSDKPLELQTHLMVTNPKEHIERLIDNGADLIAVHIESENVDINLMKHIKSSGLKTGLAINPETDENLVEQFLPFLDQVLVMGVNPGFGGQAFIPHTLNKILNINNMVKNNKISIAVDGGVSKENVHDIISRGGNVLVAGTAIFKKNIPISQAVKEFLI